LLQESVFNIWFRNNPTNDVKNRIQAQSVSDVFFDNQSQTKHRCDVEKIKCFFYLQPFWDMTKNNRKVAELNKYEYVTMNYIQFLKDIKKFPFVHNLTTVFDELPSEIPFIDPAHFNDEGHRVLAEKIAEDILKSAIF
jgi:lysophospholipase L1-like esterase